MKAIVVHEWGEPEVMRLEEVPDPAPGGDEVVVKIERVGVNPVETYIRSGIYPALPELPFVPGLDAAGVVEAVGEELGNVAVGQRVYVACGVVRRATGCYAERIAVSARAVFRLPDAASFAQGAAVGTPYATAYRGLFQRGGARPGEAVFIHGASGAVGVAAIQLARARGLTVIGSAGSERGRALVLEQGAHHVLDHGADDYIAALKDLSDGEGPDLILEMLANVNLANDLAVVARFGRIVVIGNRGTIEINPREAMTREADVRGLSMWNCSDADMASIHAALGAGLDNGTLAPVIGRELALGDAPQAHHAVLEPGAYGKIVLVP